MQTNKHFSSNQSQTLITLIVIFKLQTSGGTSSWHAWAKYVNSLVTSENKKTDLSNGETFEDTTKDGIIHSTIKDYLFDVAASIFEQMDRS